MTNDMPPSRPGDSSTPGPSSATDQAIVMGWLTTMALVLGEKISALNPKYDGVQIAFARVETTPRDMTLGLAGSNALKHQLAPIALTQKAVAAALEELERARLISREDINQSMSGFLINVEALFRFTHHRSQ